MPRLFIGLELSGDIRLQLSLLRGGLPGARWIDAENYHLTIRFVGDVDARVADEIASTLGNIARPGFPLHLNGVGAFGSKKPHAIWARVAPADALFDLQGAVERRMQRIGLPPESRKFVPHVTVARLRGAQPSAVADWLSLHGDFQTPPFEVGRFVLFSSRASRGGGPYLVEEAYPLVA